MPRTGLIRKGGGQSWQFWGGGGGDLSPEEAASKASAKASSSAASSARRERRARRKETTEVLLSAIESGDLESLEEAIDAAEASHEGTLPDGRRWCTDELKAASRCFFSHSTHSSHMSPPILPISHLEILLLRLLSEIEAAEENEARRAKLEKGQRKAVRAHADKLALVPVREEPLGVDARGRRYWAFAHDRNRLWVQWRAAVGGGGGGGGGGTPGGTPPPTGAWEWAFYDTAVSVRALLESLDGRADAVEASLKRRLRETLPLMLGHMAKDEVTNTDEGWLDSGHEWLGSRVLRIFDKAGYSFGTITKWLPADEVHTERAHTERAPPPPPPLPPKKEPKKKSPKKRPPHTLPILSSLSRFSPC